MARGQDPAGLVRDGDSRAADEAIQLSVVLRVGEEVEQAPRIRRPLAEMYLMGVSGCGIHPWRRSQRLAGRVALVPLFRYYRVLLRQRALLSHPLQPRWVAEALLIEYRKLFPRGTVS